MAEVDDTEAFWLNRGKEYISEFQRHSFFARRYFKQQEKALIKVLRSFSFENVLEVGCGFGRITKLILDEFHVRKLKGIDLSPRQIENARKYVNNGEVELLVGRVQDLDIPDDSYDLVIAVEVLMHIPFKEIETAMAELVRVSRKHIVNLDWYRPKSGTQLGGYCFAHDYSSLYEKLGATKIEAIAIPITPRYHVVLENQRFRELRRLNTLDGILSILNPPRQLLISDFPLGIRISKSHGEEQRIYHAIKD